MSERSSKQRSVNAYDPEATQTGDRPAQQADPTKEQSTPTSDLSASSVAHSVSSDDNLTMASDWQADSLLLFAERTCQLLGDQSAQQTTTQKTLCGLVRKFMGIVDAYYSRGINLLESNGDGLTHRRFNEQGFIGQDTKPYEQRQVVERLGDEWSFIMSLVSSAQLLPDSDPALTALHRVIEAGVSNLRLPVGREIAVLPHFGRHFELVKFTYAPETVVLGIPVSSLYCPWEWSVIWHEIAGIYVESQRNEQNSAITALLGELHAVLKDDAVWLAWQQQFRPEIPGLPAEGPVNRNVPTGLLDAAGRPSERILRNWSEELIEDSVGVLCLGDSMVQSLETILAQFYSNRPQDLAEVDLRHPPSKLRAEVARALSYRMGLRADDIPDSSVQRLADTILANQEKMIVNRYTPDHQRRAEQLIAALPSLETLPLDPPDQIPVAIAALAQATRMRIVSADHVRELVYQHSMLFPNQPQGTAPQGGTFNNLSLSEIQNFVFSERDLVTISEQGVHATAPHGDDRTVTVQISGWVLHGRPHGNTVSWTHRH